jgi:parvulin-like peptidyl-prolyl isomerase
MGKYIQDRLVNPPRIITNPGGLKIENLGLWFLIVSFFIASVTSWGGCTRESQTPKSPVLALVNGDTITLDELNTAFNSLIPEAGTESGPMETRRLREEVLNQLIEKKLLLQEASHRSIQATQEELELTIEQMRGDYPEQEFNELLKKSGLTPERWKQEITENLLIDKLIDSVISSRLKIPEEEVKAYYQKHHAEFQKKEEVRARQIVVATEEEAKSLHEQLITGADFVKLATEKSISPDKANGGDLGYFTRGQMPEEFDIVFTLKVNTLSTIVKSPYGYHIFKVEERHAPRFQSLVEVQEIIHQQLVSEKEEQLRSEWIKELKSKADIQVNSNLLYQAE